MWKLKRREPTVPEAPPAGDRRSAIDPEAVRRHLEKILASPEFANASRLQQFLAFVVEERLKGADSIKETELAIRVFNRRTSFDPSGDSVVRVAASNLRSRLRDYYTADGRDDRLTIELPKGSYVPLFHVREAEAKPVPPPAARPLHWKLAAAVAAAVVLAAAGFAIWRVSAPHPLASIAVLPFLNLSNATDSEYLTDGFVDEITTSLAQIEGLKVVARSSAFQFRGRSFDVRTAGRQLGVEALLEGSVRTVGGKLRISAQLVKVEDGFHIWSHTWEGESADLLAIQDDLTRSVANALRQATPARVNTPHNLEAYDLYLKGVYFKERMTAPDLAKSVEYFEQSIRKDPRYAPAWAALAGSYASMAYHEVASDPAHIRKAREAASRALEIDGALAEAHALLAWIRFFYDWDWQESESGLRRALSLNPNSSRAHEWYAEKLMSDGRFDEALAQVRQALALDPLNYRFSTVVAAILYCARRYDESIRQARQSLELNPHSYQAHTFMGVCFQEKKQYGEALAELEASHRENAGDEDTTAHLAAVLMAAGNQEHALQLYDQLKNPPGGGPPAYYELAYLELVQGHKDEALRQLELAYRQRASDMIVLQVDPVFLPLHGEPRFVALREKMGWLR